MTKTIEVNDFQTEVLEKSKEVPVLVDFWAPWCQPCKTLGPILDEIAEEKNGKMILAKLNTDFYPEIATEYQIKGIPAVKLFVNGKIEMEFTGVQPKRAILKMLDNFLPDENKIELGKIKSEIDHARPEVVITKLETLLKKAPHLDEARILLAKLLLFSDPVKSNDLVKDLLADSAFYKTAEMIRTLAGLLQLSTDEIPDGRIKEKLDAAVSFLKNQDFEQALENFIFIIVINKAFMDEIARKACVAIFTYLGNDHEISKKYRRQFDMSLY